MLHDVKRDFEKLRIFPYGILDEINWIKFSRNLDCFESNFDILCPFDYVEDPSEERRAELKDFIFYSRWIRKVYYWYIYIFFSDVNEAILIGFLVAFCIGFYLLKSKKRKNKADQVRD